MSEFEFPALPDRRELLKREEHNLETFLRAAVYSGVQSPVNGAAQLFDAASGSNTLPSLQFIDAPKNDSLAARLGSLSASAAHCGLMLALGHRLSGPLNDFGTLGKRALVTGSMGAFYGGVLSPVANTENMSAARLQNMTVGATGMAGISLFTTVYRDALAKGVGLLDAPLYHGLLVPGSLAGIATVADTQMFNREDTVFLPASRLKPYTELRNIKSR